jgi:hypothetical protein
VARREVWIARNGAPEMRPRLGVFRRREAVRVPQAALIRFPGAEALGRFAVGAFALGATQRRFDRGHDGQGHLVLNRENVV